MVSEAELDAITAGVLALQRGASLKASQSKWTESRELYAEARLLGAVRDRFAVEVHA